MGLSFLIGLVLRPCLSERPRQPQRVRIAPLPLLLGVALWAVGHQGTQDLTLVILVQTSVQMVLAAAQRLFATP